MALLPDLTEQFIDDFQRQSEELESLRSQGPRAAEDAVRARDEAVKLRDEAVKLRGEAVTARNAAVFARDAALAELAEQKLENQELQRQLKAERQRISEPPAPVPCAQCAELQRQLNVLRQENEQFKAQAKKADQRGDGVAKLEEELKALKVEYSVLDDKRKELQRENHRLDFDLRKCLDGR